MMRTFFRGRTRAMGITIAIPVVAIGFAVAPGSAGATAPGKAGLPKVCREAKVTPALVRRIFGSSAVIGGKGVSETGRCAMESGTNGNPPSGCIDDDSTCVNTDVHLQGHGAYKTDRANEVYQLDSYGHAHVTKFSGAGAGAVLMISTKGYGGAANPLVLFRAGHHTAQIGGPFAGDGETKAVYKEWEQLARAVYSRLD